MPVYNSQARLAQINVSPGGVPKKPVPGVQIDRLGLAGDSHTYEDHGGPERAVCLYALELIQALQAEGHPITPGAAGENLTTTGLDWSRVSPGARLQIGEDVVLEVTRFTVPCKTIRAAFAAENYHRISQTEHPGWSRVYARVVNSGFVQTGDAITIL